MARNQPPPHTHIKAHTREHASPNSYTHTGMGRGAFSVSSGCACRACCSARFVDTQTRKQVCVARGCTASTDLLQPCDWWSSCCYYFFCCCCSCCSCSCCSCCRPSPCQLPLLLPPLVGFLASSPAIMLKQVCRGERAPHCRVHIFSRSLRLPSGTLEHYSLARSLPPLLGGLLLLSLLR